jgi:hypothetical protein
MTLLAFGLLGIYDMRGSGALYADDIWIIIVFQVGGLTTHFVQVPGHGATFRVSLHCS